MRLEFGLIVERFAALKTHKASFMGASVSDEIFSTSEKFTATVAYVLLGGVGKHVFFQQILAGEHSTAMVAFELLQGTYSLGRHAVELLNCRVKHAAVLAYEYITVLSNFYLGYPWKTKTDIRQWKQETEKR